MKLRGAGTADRIDGIQSLKNTAAILAVALFLEPLSATSAMAVVDCAAGSAINCNLASYPSGISFPTVTSNTVLTVNNTATATGTSIGGTGVVLGTVTGKNLTVTIQNALSTISTSGGSKTGINVTAKGGTVVAYVNPNGYGAGGSIAVTNAATITTDGSGSGGH